MNTDRQRPDPSYRKHRQSGQAVVTLRDQAGHRHDILLGRYCTKESKREYRRIIAEWEENDYTYSPHPTADMALNELILAYMKHVETYYRHGDGSPTSEVDNQRLALRPLKALYGHTAAAEFDSVALEVVRGQMVRDGRCRTRVNKDVARIKRLFRWAGAKKLVPSSVFHDLECLEGLRAGRSEARETPPVLPVPRNIVEQTLTVMLPTLADMVRVQLECGMRPGEICAIRVIDIDMNDPSGIWLYRPAQHKTQHLGHERVIPIGRKAQEIIRRHFKTDLQAYLFTPADVMAEYHAQQRQNRKTPVQPSQQDRRKRNPKRRPSQMYAKSSYANAVADACDKAFPPPERLRPQIKENGKRETHKEYRARLTDQDKAELLAWRKEHRWHPHRLRHTRARELKREVGLDAARAILGHRSPIVTEHYATLDVGKAVEVMAKLG
jgi:integrase